MLPELEPPPHLKKAVFLRLQREKRRAARFKLAGFSALAIISFALIFPAINYLLGQLASSGFSQYVSLIFSDGAYLTSYWQEFILALAESLPVLGLIAVLASIFTLLNSLRVAAKNIKPANAPIRLASR